MADSPVQTDITIVQGQTKAFSATWAIDDVPKSLAGYEAHLQIRRRAGNYSSAPLVDVSSIDGSDPATVVVEPNEETGKVKVRIPGDLTAGLTRNAWYDLFVVNSTDPTERVRLVFGQVLISKSATDNAAFVALVADVDPDDAGSGSGGSGSGSGSGSDADAIFALQSQMAEALDDITSMQQALAGKVGSTALGEAILALQEQIDDLPSPPSITGLATNTALSDAVQELQAQLDALPDPPSISGLATVTALSDAVADLQAQIDALPAGGGGGGGEPPPTLAAPGSFLTGPFAGMEHLPLLRWQGGFEAAGDVPLESLRALKVYLKPTTQISPSDTTDSYPGNDDARPFNYGDPAEPFQQGAHEGIHLLNGTVLSNNLNLNDGNYTVRVEATTGATTGQPMIDSIRAALSQSAPYALVEGYPRTGANSGVQWALNMRTDAQGSDYLILAIDCEDADQASGYLLLLLFSNGRPNVAYVIEIAEDGSFTIVASGYTDSSVVISGDTMFIAFDDNKVHVYTRDGGFLDYALPETQSGLHSYFAVDEGNTDLSLIQTTQGIEIVTQPGALLATTSGQSLVLLPIAEQDVEMVATLENTAGVEGPQSAPFRVNFTPAPTAGPSTQDFDDLSSSVSSLSSTVTSLGTTVAGLTAGHMIQVKGDWAGDATYAPNDLVRYEGSYYLARTNIVPAHPQLINAYGQSAPITGSDTGVSAFGDASVEGDVWVLFVFCADTIAPDFADGWTSLVHNEDGPLHAYIWTHTLAADELSGFTLPEPDVANGQLFWMTFHNALAPTAPDISLGAVEDFREMTSWSAQHSGLAMVGYSFKGTDDTVYPEVLKIAPGHVDNDGASLAAVHGAAGSNDGTITEYTLWPGAQGGQGFEAVSLIGSVTFADADSNVQWGFTLQPAGIITPDQDSTSWALL